MKLENTNLDKFYIYFSPIACQLSNRCIRKRKKEDTKNIEGLYKKTLKFNNLYILISTRNLYYLIT